MYETSKGSQVSARSCQWREGRRIGQRRRKEEEEEVVVNGIGAGMYVGAGCIMWVDDLSRGYVGLTILGI